MTPSRRTLLGGLLATLAAPVIIRTPGLLMPVRTRRPILTMNEVMREAMRMCRDDTRFLAYINDYQFRITPGQTRIRLPAAYRASGRTA